ncbi:MAG: site-specific tyrosine recombinase/integron integrase [Bacilli bacterium]|jgi:integrase/recombinase XerD|nr:tyrosine-type recombinase/integrase [Erysipelotrichia bacterium]
MQNQIKIILSDMSDYLNIAQMKLLQESLVKRLEYEINNDKIVENNKYLTMYLSAKQVEGCSVRTLSYYQSTVEKMLSMIEAPIRKITTEIIRDYLKRYQLINNCSRTTVDNIRRNLSSFFSWLEEENHILKNPVRRIKKIKVKTTIKEIISDEQIEVMRDACTNKRDLAIVEMLYSTGIRVGELAKLDIKDINFSERECIVYGKGDKERKVYFDAKTKLHLKQYLDERKDGSQALFVTLNKPFERIQISGIEIRIRNLGRSLGYTNIHPHKFRRTMATRAIDKGMPIEQVQQLLGHQQIDTTMKYAMVNQSNVKNSHKKFIG